MATLNVQDYGAVGDGSADDTEAIQSAIDDAEAGDEVYLPGTSNSYLVSGDQGLVNFSPSESDIRFYGDGEETVIKYDGGNGGNNIFQLFVDPANTGISGLVIENLVVDGGIENVEGDPNVAAGIQVGSPEDSAAEGNMDVLIRDVKATKCYGNGIDARCAGVRVEYCTAIENRQHGFGMHTAGDPFQDPPVEFTRCLSKNNAAGGGYYGMDTSAGKAIVTECVMTGNQGAGASKCSQGANRMEYRRCRLKDDAGFAFQNTGNRGHTIIFEDIVIDNCAKGLRLSQNGVYRVADDSEIVSTDTGSYNLGAIYFTDTAHFDAPNATVWVNNHSGSAGIRASAEGPLNEIGTYYHEANEGGAIGGSAQDNLSIGTQSEDTKTDLENVPREGEVGAFLDSRPSVPGDSTSDRDDGSTDSEDSTSEQDTQQYDPNTDTQSPSTAPDSSDLSSTGSLATSSEARDADSAIFGNVVTGVVNQSKSDLFHIDGQLTEFEAQEGVTIIYEGEEYTPEELQEELPECDIQVFSTRETSEAESSSENVTQNTTDNSDVSFSTEGSTCQWEAPEGNQRYVSPDGSGDGTESNPWSVDQANASAQAGDVVNFLPGEYSETISPENSGERDNPIVFRSQEFHGAKMTEYGVGIQNKSDIVVEGFNFDRENNSGQIWIQVSDGSERIVIKDNMMQSHVGNRNPCYIADSENIRFEGNLARETTKGDMITFDNCDKIVVEGNDLSRAGHAPLNSDSTRSQDMVLRDNVMHAAVGRNCGWWRDINVLNEGNAYVNSFDGPGSADSTSKIHGNNLIFRFNQVSDNYGTGVKTTHYGDLDELIHARFYNNVFDSNRDAYNPKDSTPEIAYGGFAMWGYGQEGNIRDVRLENNVFSRNNDSEIYIDRVPENELVYNNNTFWNDDRNAFIRHNGRKTVSEAESNIPQVYSDNSEEKPEFVNLDTRDYHPADNSPLRESGNYLTRTSSSGSGSQVPVEDTYYFYDGFGIYGEKGDIVQIGDTRARVTNVDHNSGVIEIDRDLQWGGDDPVGLPWSGNRPDKGIFETGNGRKSVRVIKDHHQASVGDEIKLRAQLIGNAEIDSVRWYLGNGEIVCGDGSGVSVTYQDAYDYGIRAKVIDSDGEINWGVDYVMVSDGQTDVTSLEFNKSECDRVLCSKPGYEGDGRAGGYHCS